MRSGNFQRLMAVTLALATAFVTMPLTAADFSTARPVIGSVRAVGSVELRGVGISQEGTLFSGDSIRANPKGYAQVLIGTGSKIELNEKTDVRFNRDARGIQIAMNSGLVGFTAKTPLRIDVAPFEVTASDDASGIVLITNPLAADVRAINGKVTVRNLKTSESFVLTKGQEEFLGLKDGVHGPALGQIAANVPSPLPAPNPAPQTPAGKTTGGLAMDTGAWLAVIGGAAVAGIAVWGVLSAEHANDRIDNLTNQLATANFNIAAGAVNAAALQAQLKSISTANAIAQTSAAQQIELLQVAQLATQAQIALAGNPAQAAIASSLASQATASQARLQTLQSQIQALQAQLASGTGSQQQLQNLLNQEETERQNSNNLANQLNTLLNNNRNVTGVPGGSIGTVGPPASASVPV